MALRPSLITRGISTSGPSDTGSPARDDAKKNMLKAMRPLPTQHCWDIYFDRQQKDQKPAADGSYTATLDKLPTQVESIQDFWRYCNNTPFDQIKMRESIYLFKQGFQPVWEDRRNINGGSWTFRVPKQNGPDFFTRVQLMAIGEKLQGCLESGDQLCGVGLSVRFNSHLISIWHRDASKQKSIDALLATVMEELPQELKPKPDNFFYKKHSDHAGFKAPPAESTSESAQTESTASKIQTEVPAA
ncbi:hypothetical protein BHYA_0274g00100 [Botrytis hyacinthi]|uniref:Translation initiation factor 4e n=1 Tax=Botrytis hyacinthi TaxID=278943 RepID=A0A4Z1G7T1_9HELO|nr:hypothetical protein BHYA_0274g00100 [Botrytis hyacinthi]